MDNSEADTSNHSRARADRSTDSVGPKVSFLAGEDTPVWIGYYANPNDKALLTYRKLEKGVRGPSINTRIILPILFSNSIAYRELT